MSIVNLNYSGNRDIVNYLVNLLKFVRILMFTKRTVRSFRWCLTDERVSGKLLLFYSRPDWDIFGLFFIGGEISRSLVCKWVFSKSGVENAILKLLSLCWERINCWNLKIRGIRWISARMSQRRLCYSNERIAKGWDSGERGYSFFPHCREFCDWVITSEAFLGSVTFFLERKN